MPDKGFFDDLSKWLVIFMSLIFLLLPFSAIEAGEIILESRFCNSTKGAEINASVLSNALKSGNTVVIPQGRFSLNSVFVSGLSNTILKGTVSGSARLSELNFIGSEGLIISNNESLQINDIDISGPSSSDLIVLKSGKGFKANNTNVITNLNLSESCLYRNLDWLIPVLHILL